MRSTLASPRAVGISLAAGLLTIGVTYVTPRVSRRGWLAATAGLLPVLAFLGYPIVPAFTVDATEAGRSRSCSATARSPESRTERPGARCSSGCPTAGCGRLV
ncbi:MAG TPA: hypothetical protein VLJ59_13915 [Mycobacteriales bacterium]|nr:hypothetical protein [Mycobacteriales bacterium]